MIKKQLATAVSVVLIGTLATSMVFAEEKKIVTKSDKDATMVKLIDALYESGTIDTKAYEALRISAQADAQSKNKEQEVIRENVKQVAAEEGKKSATALVDERVKPAHPNDLNGSYKKGFAWGSEDMQHQLVINGRIQTDYRVLNSADELTTDKFDLRRAYLQFSGHVYDKWEYMFIGGFNSSQARPIFWYMNAHLWKEAQLQFGQLRVPFGQNEWTSSRNIDFIERSLPMQFIPGIDKGIMLHGMPIHGLYYAFAAVNGGVRSNAGLPTTVEDTSDVDGKDLIGHVALDMAKVLGHKDNIYNFGVSYGFGSQPTGTATSSTDRSFSPISRTESGSGLTSFQSDNFSTVDNSIELNRFGAQTIIAHGPYKFAAEYVKNRFEGTAKATRQNFNRDLDSYYLSAFWLLTGEKYADFFSNNGSSGDVIPHHNFDMKGGWGAWELGVRYSHLDASDFTFQNAVGTGRLSSGMSNESDAYTVGLKWYVNPQVRFLANYVHSEFNMPIGKTNEKSESALSFRAQLQF
ncbi:MAG: porin [Methylococcales bacterium]|nr:porin [Methylococcales bacterium]